MKTLNHKGYEITVEQVKHNGYYRLSTWVHSMGEEYQETMLADTLDNETLDKFINQIELHK